MDSEKSGMSFPVAANEDFKEFIFLITPQNEFLPLFNNVEGTAD